MTRTIAYLVCALFAPAPSLASYGWTISASSTDPYVNVGSASGVERDLYLWLVCATVPQEMTAAQLGIESTGIVHLATNMNPVTANAGTTDCLLVATSSLCGFGASVIARLTVLDLSGSLAITSCDPLGGDNEFLLSVDCQSSPQPWPIDWIGYSNVGPPPGKGGGCLEPISVNQWSWGRVKTLYR